MLDDFMYGFGQFTENGSKKYDEYDLLCGISWAEYQLELGLKEDYHYGFDLNSFINWSKLKLSIGGNNG